MDSGRHLEILQELLESEAELGKRYNSLVVQFSNTAVGGYCMALAELHTKFAAILTRHLGSVVEGYRRKAEIDEKAER